VPAFGSNALRKVAEVIMSASRSTVSAAGVARRASLRERQLFTAAKEGIALVAQYAAILCTM
jgi:hypothetical protein